MFDMLASQTVTFLVPYLKKAAQGAGMKLYEIVKEKFSSDPILKEMFDSFEQSPDNDSKQQEIKSKLQSIIDSDQLFKDRLVEIVNKNYLNTTKDITNVTNNYGSIGKHINMDTVNGDVNIS